MKILPWSYADAHHQLDPPCIGVVSLTRSGVHRSGVHGHFVCCGMEVKADMVHCVRSCCREFLSGLMTLCSVGGCPLIALSTPVGLLPVDELDLTFAILGRWGAIRRSASPRVVLPRIVSPRLVS